MTSLRLKRQLYNLISMKLNVEPYQHVRHQIFAFPWVFYQQQGAIDVRLLKTRKILQIILGMYVHLKGVSVW